MEEGYMKENSIENIEEKLESFLRLAVKERYESLNDNIRDFEKIISKEKLNEYR